MMKSLFLNVRILSPSVEIFEGEAQYCFIPTPEGLTKVLPRHMPIAGRISSGVIRLIQDGGTEKSYTVMSGGFYRITPDSAHIWVS